MMPRRRQKSAFFPDTEDEETSCAEAAPRVPPMNTSFRMAPQGRAVLSRHEPKSPKGLRSSTSLSPKPAPFNSGAYLGTIEFPSTRSVLWDRRPLGAAQVIHPEEAIVPKITLTAAVLGQIHEAVLRRSSGPQLLGHVLYSQVTSSQNWAIHGTAFSVNTDPRNLSRPPSSFPVYVVLKEPRELGSLSSHEAMVHGTTYTLQHGGPLDVALSMRLVVSLFMPTQLNLTMELVAPTAEVHLLPIRNLPLLLTPLAKALMKLQSTHESGLVTLDRTRKMVPLLPTDPLATSRPLVGLWLQASSATSMYYQSLLYHTVTVAGREQLWVAPQTCLVVKYPTETKQWLPEFFEMKLGTETTSPATVGLFTTTRRVTVGRSANVDVVELYLQQSHQPVPTAHVTTTASPAVHEPEPAPHADESMSYEELPTPMPRQPPTNPVAKPVFRPLSPPPRPSPPVQVSSSDLLREHQEQMQAMQRQIQMLQDQLQAVQCLYKNAAATKETQSVGTNTSFVVASPRDAPAFAAGGMIESLPLGVVPSSPDETTGGEVVNLNGDPPIVGGDDDAARLVDARTVHDPPLAVQVDDARVVVDNELCDKPDVVEVRQSAPTRDASLVDDTNADAPLSDDEPSSGIQYLVEPEEVDDYLSEPSSVTYPLLRTQFDSATLGAPAMPASSSLLQTMDIPRIRYHLSRDDDSEEDEVEVRAIEAKYLKRMVKS